MCFDGPRRGLLAKSALESYLQGDTMVTRQKIGVNDNKLTKTGGFARIPWSLRTLINKALTYREAAVYLQVALHCDKTEAYSFGLDKLAASLGWKRTNALYTCLKELVNSGFLVVRRTRLSGHRKYWVNVYQRPCVGHTFRTLQTEGYVGSGRKITPQEFDEAFQLYVKKDSPHEPPHLRFVNRKKTK